MPKSLWQPPIPNINTRWWKTYWTGNSPLKNPGQVWVSDITYVKTGKGRLYLTIILDIFDRKVIGWALSNDLRAENTSVAAWRMAVKNRIMSQKLIFHSDRGVQYACHGFADLLENYKCIERIMSGKGNCWDNAVAESFFKTIRTELVHRNRYTDKNRRAISVFEWIETWYNRNRRHSALGNPTIMEFENLKQFKNVA